MYEWHDLVGNLGVFFILATYLLLQLDRLSSRTAAFSLANALGAGLILVSLSVEFNLSAFVIEAFWLVISLAGLARRAWSAGDVPGAP